MSVKEKKAGFKFSDANGDGGLRQTMDTGMVVENILRFMEGAVFFLNSRLEIMPHYSDALERMLACGTLTQRNFIEILEKRVPEQIARSTLEYLELMFQKDLDEPTLMELNPLQETEFVYEDDFGLWTSSRNLSFRFHRVYKDAEIIALIGVGADVTQKIANHEKLKHIEEHTQKQMEWLVNIIHVEPDLLMDFFTGLEQEITKIESVLKNAKKTGKHKEILETIYRSLYIIKGNASLLDLKFFVAHTSRFLDAVVNIRNKDEIEGTDFVPVVVQLGELKKTTDEIKTIFQRIRHFHDNFRAKRSYESKLLVNALKNLIYDLSKQLGKRIEFDAADLDALSIPYTYRRLVRDILFLLIRNTVLYAIENPEQRRTANKSPAATIKISSFINEKSLSLILRHDGHIARIERLLEKMLHQDLSAQEQSNGWEGVQITQMLLMPNSPHGDEKELITNYSMDMEALKRKLKENSGRLKITFTSEQFCEFTVTLPLKN